MPRNRPGTPPPLGERLSAGFSGLMFVFSLIMGSSSIDRRWVVMFVIWTVGYLYGALYFMSVSVDKNGGFDDPSQDPENDKKDK